MQKKAARTVPNVDLNVRSTNNFSILNWMTLYQKISFNRCICMYKVANNLVPDYLLKYFKWNDHFCNYCLRSSSDSSHNFKIDKPRTELYKRSILYNGVALWNDLPVSVKMSNNLVKFKKKLSYVTIIDAKRFQPQIRY